MTSKEFSWFGRDWSGNGSPNPCRHCEERFAGCHAECDAYKSWIEEIRERKAIVNAERKKQNIVDSHVKDAVEKNRRRQTTCS